MNVPVMVLTYLNRNVVLILTLLNRLSIRFQALSHEWWLTALSLLDTKSATSIENCLLIRSGI